MWRRFHFIALILILGCARSNKHKNIPSAITKQNITVELGDVVAGETLESEIELRAHIAASKASASCGCVKPSIIRRKDRSFLHFRYTPTGSGGTQIQEVSVFCGDLLPCAVIDLRARPHLPIEFEPPLLLLTKVDHPVTVNVRSYKGTLPKEVITSKTIQAKWSSYTGQHGVLQLRFSGPLLPGIIEDELRLSSETLPVTFHIAGPICPDRDTLDLVAGSNTSPIQEIHFQSREPMATGVTAEATPDLIMLKLQAETSGFVLKAQGRKVAPRGVSRGRIIVKRNGKPIYGFPFRLISIP